MATLKAKAQLLLNKAEEVKGDMETKLTAEQKIELETRKKTAIENLTAAKQTLETAITQAESNAKQFLNGLKQVRKNKYN